MRSPLASRPSLTASARNAPTRIPPADRAFPIAATAPDTKPALRLTAPPKAAEIAPCPSATSPATSVRTAVAINCHRRMVRIGRLSMRVWHSCFPPAAKRRKYIRIAHRGSTCCGAISGLRPSAQFLQQLVEVIESGIAHQDRSTALAAGPDLHRGSHPLRDFLLEPRQIAIRLVLAAAGRTAVRGRPSGSGAGVPAGTHGNRGRPRRDRVVLRETPSRVEEPMSRASSRRGEVQCGS